MRHLLPWLRSRLQAGYQLNSFKSSGDAFEPYARQGRLAAVIYYNWMSKPGCEPSSIVRCGALTNAGKLALSLM